MSELKTAAPAPAGKAGVDLSNYVFNGADCVELDDLSALSEQDRHTLLMSGLDVEALDKSGTYLQINHAKSHCKSHNPGVEVLDIKEALKRYDGLKDHYWKLVDPDKDEFTRSVAENTHGGYFIRVKAGVKVTEPVQSCLFIRANQVGQNVHNIIIVEDDAELHILSGCAVSEETSEAAHLGISEFWVGKRAKLSFTMIHNWAENIVVRPRSAGVVDEEGVFLSNYICLKPVRDIQMYPTIELNGRGSVARFNSVIVAPPGTHLDTGNRIILNAPETRGEIIARTITTGGTIINRGDIQARALPSKGHLECKGLILNDGIIHAIPELYGSLSGVELSHEAAVGKIAQEEIEYLMARGLDEDEATSTIVRGFLNVDIMGLPDKLKETIEQTISESEKDMF